MSDELVFFRITLQKYTFYLSFEQKQDEDFAKKREKLFPAHQDSSKGNIFYAYIIEIYPCGMQHEPFSRSAIETIAHNGVAKPIRM